MAGVVEGLNLIVDLDASGLEHKITSLVGSVGDAFKKLEDINIDKLMKNLSSGGINWNSIISKLFSPANLIAFFSAMAATGIIASISEQATVGNAPSAGLLPGGATGPAGTGIISSAQGTSDATGQAATDVETATEALIPALGDNVDAAEQLSAQVALVANASGTSASNVANAFAPILQALGITDVGNATALLTSFANAAAQSNTPIQTLIAAWSPFADQAKIANLSQAALNSNIQQFGASVEGSGIPGAQAAFQTLFDTLTGANEGAIALGKLAGGAGELKSEVADGQTATALNNISTATKGLIQNGQLTLLGGSFDLTAAGIAAMSGKLTAYPISTQQTIQALFAASVTPMTNFNQALQTFVNLSSKTFGGPLVDVLTAMVNGLTFIMQHNNALLVFGGVFLALAAASFGGLISTLAAIPAAAAAVTALASGTTATAAGVVAAAEGGVGLTSLLAVASTVLVAAGAVLAAVGVAGAVLKNVIPQQTQSNISNALAPAQSALYGSLGSIFPPAVLDFFQDPSNPIVQAIRGFMTANTPYNPTVGGSIGVGTMGQGTGKSTLNVVLSPGLQAASQQAGVNGIQVTSSTNQSVTN